METEVTALKSTAKQRYDKLGTDRQHFLDRARDASELTIPALIPPSGFEQSSELYIPFQSVGARGVNNLASKLLLLLLPPNSPFFRLGLTGKSKLEVMETPELMSQVEESLAGIERAVTQKIEELAIRVSVFEALKHLIIGGNVLCYMPKKGNMRVYPLSQYVCRRDGEGNLLEVVIKETVASVSLDEATLEALGKVPDYKDDEPCDIYTHIYRLDNKKFYICQEVHGIKIESSVGIFPQDQLPYLCLRMIRVDTEDYGRGYVEEFLGDLKSLEGLSQALVESAAASSKVVFLVRPNAVTRKRDLAESRNGDIITGSRDDVSVLQSEKQYDLQIVERSIQRLEERMSYAFLLHTAVQRDAERVTAQEIRYMAQQLEASLGGVYSLLSQEFQLPLVNILMKRMGQNKEVPELPKDTLTTTIITGIEALGRGNDLQKLREFIGEIVQLAGVNPEFMSSLNPSDLITRLATGLGIDTEGLIKSAEQLQAEQEAMMQAQQQEQMMGMAEKAVAPVAGEVARQAGEVPAEE